MKIEDIKILIPDYITGSLNKEEAEIVENAIRSNNEIADLYNEMKNAFDFVNDVKFDEPMPQYWNNLLPRIHEKIEAKEQKGLFKAPIPLLWKILLPVAAVILIFIIYKIAYTPETQFTQKKIDTIQQQTQKEQNTEKKIEPVEKQQAENNIEPKLNVKQTINKRYHFTENNKFEKSSDQDNLAQNEQKTESTETELLDAFASVDANDIATLTETEGTGIDEELINEMDKLNSNDKEIILEELSKTDL